MTFDWVEWFNDVIQEVTAKNETYYFRHKEEIKAYQKIHKKRKREYDKQYRTTPNGKQTKRKTNARRSRQFGYKELFDIPIGYCAHHIDDIIVVPVPELIHQQFSGYDRETHRKLVLDWLHDNDPDLWVDCRIYLNNF